MIVYCPDWVERSSFTDPDKARHFADWCDRHCTCKSRPHIARERPHDD